MNGNPPATPRIPESQSAFEQKLRDMNEALLISSLKQHELAEQVGKANAVVREIFSQALARHAPAVDVRLIEGQAQTALIAADVVMVASGTASLEAALCKRPMVVVYRLGALTAWVLRRLNLVKSKFFAQPNLLADRRVVGEYFQEEIIPESIGAELLMWLDDAERRTALELEFARIHADLRRDAGMRAAQAILDLVKSRGRAVTESP